jgi:FkbM family methyltransferase
MPPPFIAHQMHSSRLGRLGTVLRFVRDRGCGVKERFRLLYHVGLRRGVVHRGWSKRSPEKTIQLRFRGLHGGLVRACLQDNGLDMNTFIEFFASSYTTLPRELPPFEPNVIYDLGANIGIASLYFASHFPRAKVFGFEPVPANFQTCSLNFQGLAGAQCFPWAIGASSGTCHFDFDSEDLRGGHLGDGGQAGGKQRIEVSVCSVADLVAKKGLPAPDFLKIDVEGAEVAVLQGIGAQLASIKRMLVETHSEELKAACLDWMRANGFVLRHLTEAAPGYAAVWCDRFSVR